MNINLTPVVICTNKEIEQPIEKNRCSNVKCENHKKYLRKDKFCPDCGWIIEKYTEMETEWQINPWELVEAMKEKLTHTPHDWLLAPLPRNKNIFKPNIKVDGIYQWTADYDTDEFIDPSKIEYDKILDNFIKQFKKEIAILKKAYGNYNVIIEWKLFVTCS